MSFGINTQTCATCGKPIREDDAFCSDLCEAEMERQLEEDE